MEVLRESLHSCVTLSDQADSELADSNSDMESMAGGSVSLMDDSDFNDSVSTMGSIDLEDDLDSVAEESQLGHESDSDEESLEEDPLEEEVLEEKKKKGMMYRMTSADGIFGIFGSKRNLLAAETKRRGRRNGGDSTPTDERIVHRFNTSGTLTPTIRQGIVPDGRGVARTNTSDTLKGVHHHAAGANDMPQPAGAKTRRGGRRNREGTKPAAVSEPQRGVCRNNTSDSLARGVRPTKTPDSLVARGVPRTNTSDSLARGIRSPFAREAKRGVARTSTSDSLQGVDHSKVAAATIAEKPTPQPTRTRRGGRRNQEDTSTPKPAPSPQRGVFRNNTSDSLSRGMRPFRRADKGTNDSLLGKTLPPQAAHTRRGGRRDTTKPAEQRVKELYHCADASTVDESVSESSDHLGNSEGSDRHLRMVKTNSEGGDPHLRMVKTKSV
jgi:hypothetical protein